MPIQQQNVYRGAIQQALTTLNTTIEVNGDNTAIAAPGAGKHVVIVEGNIENVSAAETTVSLKEGADVRFDCSLDPGESILIEADEAFLWELPANTALVVNLSGANSHKVWLRYFVEDA